jgi:chromosome partitioning protein
MIVTFGGQKGGSGKSTAALAVAAELHARGRRVLLVDADPQGTLRTWADVAAEQGHAAPTVVAMGPSMYRADQLPRLAAGYDDVIIDAPPRHDEIQRAALMVADLVVLPCGPSPLDAWALVAGLDLVKRARALRPELRAVVLITRVQSRTSLGAGARETLNGSGLPVLATELGLRVAYQEAPAAGVGVTQYEPRGQAADEVRALVDELEKIGRRT